MHKAEAPRRSVGAQIFISYARADNEGSDPNGRWLDRVKQHLKPLASRGVLSIWSDHEIQAGDRWHETIRENLLDARVAVLLISPSFLASDYIRKFEMPVLAERAMARELVIVPLTLRPCLFETAAFKYPDPETGPKIFSLAQLQAAHPSNTPLSSLDQSGQDRTLVKLAQSIEHLLPKQSIEIAISRYREAFLERHQRWDVSPTGPAAFGTTVVSSPSLDQMYVPLSFAEQFSRNSGEEKPLQAQDIVDSRKNTVISGPAGCGKTTWMRWTFREFLRNRQTFPFLIELRTLAHAWERASGGGKDRSLLGFFEGLLEEYGLGDVARRLLEVFCNPTEDLSSVLLLDGWDELGELGTDVRHKLSALLRACPGMIAVVTSRPFGGTRPSEAENFRELTFRELTDDQIGILAGKFFRYHRNLESGAARQKQMEFLRLLRSHRETHDLARTALLLTIILLRLGTEATELVRSRRKLYQRCVERILSGLPEDKKKSGALSLAASFCPTEPGVITAMVGCLAFGFYGTGVSQWRESSAEKTWESVTRLLPASWGEEQRDGFILWLLEGAGLLVAEFDGNNLRFLHRSFQEYLTAEHIFRDDKLFWGFFHRDPSSNEFWEPLIHWAGIAAEEDPERLTSRMLELSADGESGFWLAGALFAQGFGKEPELRVWIQALYEKIRFVWHDGVGSCARYWSRTTHRKRKTALEKALNVRFEAEGWLAQTRYLRWAELAEFSVPTGTALPVRLEHGWLKRAPVASRGLEFARQRILCGMFPAGGFPPRETVPLLLWPNQRREAGYRLQILSDLTPDEALLREVAGRVLLPQRWTAEDARFAVECARDIARLLTTRAPHDAAADLAPERSRSWVRRMKYPWVCDLFLEMVQRWYVGRTEGGQGSPGDFWFEAIVCFGDESRYTRVDLKWIRDLASRWADDLGLRSAPRDLATNFGIVELMSLGRAHARADVLEKLETPESAVEKLMHTAVKASLSANGDQAPPAKHGAKIPSFWTSLAKHLTRCATERDFQILQRAVENAEGFPEPVNWGLQFLVRGDVVRRDGTIFRLDDLSDSLGLPRLPLLESMPDELEL